MMASFLPKSLLNDFKKVSEKAMELGKGLSDTLLSPLEKEQEEFIKSKRAQNEPKEYTVSPSSPSSSQLPWIVSISPPKEHSEAKTEILEISKAKSIEAFSDRII
jgi:hypothetical protein